MKQTDREEAFLQILELTPPITLEQLKSNYRDLIQVWHPDRHSHNERLKTKAEEKLKLINEAYEHVLSNISKFGSRSESQNYDTNATTSEFNNCCELATSAMQVGNHAEAHRYYSRCLELDVTSGYSWIGKGTSAGWQSTFLEPRLAEMCMCYSKGMELLPVEDKERMREPLELTKINIVSAFFSVCRGALMEVLPVADAGPSGNLKVWKHYLNLCLQMIEILEGSTAHAQVAQRLILAICKDNIEGAKYTDLTTVEFGINPIRTLFLTDEYERILRQKMAVHGNELKSLDPTYSLPHAERPSGGCFIATCVCGAENDPHVVALRQFRDSLLCNWYAGKLLIRIYNRHSPSIADRIVNKSLTKKVLFVMLIKPLALLAARFVRRRSIQQNFQ